MSGLMKPKHDKSLARLNCFHESGLRTFDFNLKRPNLVVTFYQEDCLRENVSSLRIKQIFESLCMRVNLLMGSDSRPAALAWLQRPGS